MFPEESLEKIINKSTKERMKIAKQEQLNEMIQNDLDDKKDLHEHYSKFTDNENKDDKFSFANQNSEPELKNLNEIQHLVSTAVDKPDNDLMDLNFDNEFISEAFDDQPEANESKSQNEKYSNFIPGWNIWSGQDIVHDNKTKRKMIKLLDRKAKRMNLSIYKAISKTPYERMANKEKV